MNCYKKIVNAGNKNGKNSQVYEGFTHLRYGI
jgi:hypothetical protein